MADVVVYTAVTGGRDALKDPEVVLPNVDYYCFTDEPFASEAWNVVRIPTGENPRLTSRRYKLLSHVLFPHHRYTIWHDGSMTATKHVLESVAELNGASVGMFRHPRRNCVYDEARACIVSGREREQVAMTQVERYKRMRFPSQFGLYAGGFIVREHTKEVEVMNSMWWAQVSSGSVRDQLSFTYVLWRTGMSVVAYAGTVYENKFVKHDMEDHLERMRPVL